MLKLFFWTIIIGIVFRVVLNFLLPLVRVTSAATVQMRRMQERMKEMERQMHEQSESKKQKKVSKDDDYIEYEELR